MNTKPLELSNVTKWHSAGYTGNGVTIAVIDSAGKPRNHMRDYYVDIFGDQAESGHGANEPITRTEMAVILDRLNK